jgi:hypothetical protein
VSRFVRCDLVPRTFGDPAEMLHGNVLRLALLLLREEHEGFLLQQLQVQHRTLQFLFVVVVADPVFRLLPPVRCVATVCNCVQSWRGTPSYADRAFLSNPPQPAVLTKHHEGRHDSSAAALPEM